MPLFGTREVEFSRFRGVCFDQSPAELDNTLASDCQDVVFEGEYLKMRGGKKAYNTTSPTSNKVMAIGAYYPVSGTRKLTMVAGTAWYADVDQNGSFEQTVATVTAGANSDIFQWRNTLYLGNGSDGMFKWTGSGAGSAVALLTAPPIVPALQLSQTIINAFDTNTGGGAWTLSGSALTRADNSAKAIEGSNCLQLSATGSGAEGSSISKVWESAATVDLSGAAEVWVSVFSQQINNSFIIAVSDNGGTIDYDLFPPYTIVERDKWIVVKVPLSGIPPESRTASTKIGIKWVNAPSYSANRVVYFDRAVAVGPLSTGDYKYWCTFADVDTSGIVIAESNPSSLISAAATPLINIPDPSDDTLPALGITVLVPTPAAASDADQIRIYRFLTSGEFRWPRLVKTLAKTTDWTAFQTTLTGSHNSSTTAFTVGSTTGLSANEYLMLDTEVIKIVSVDTGTTLTVTRAQYGTAAASHDGGVTIARAVIFTDSKDDGSIAVEDTDVLATDNKIAPPPAQSWAVVNNRVLAGAPTVGGTAFPQRIYLTEFDYPERFASAQLPDFPTSAGWFELPAGDPIRRIVEFDGMAVIFTDKSVWSIDGSGWDDFTFRQRLYVGLDARNAVAVHGRFIYFLSQDGVRVLAPNHSNDGVWDSWVISEPVDSKLLAIPGAYRNLCAMGVDERERIVLSIVRSGQTLPDRELVFDTKEPGALSSAYDRQRPGWTFHSRGHACYLRLKRGNPDEGQLLAGDNSYAVVWYLNKDGDDAALTADYNDNVPTTYNAVSISWHYQTSALDSGSGGKASLVFTDLLADASIGTTTTLAEALDATEPDIDVADGTVTYVGGYVQVDSEVMAVTAIASNTLTVTRGVAGTVGATHSNGATVTPVSVITGTPILDGAASSATQLMNLGTSSSGIVTARRRYATAANGRHLQVKLSGVHRTAQAIRRLVAGVFVR